MTKEELAKISIEEFSRLQKWMLFLDTDSEAYKLMYERYTELKAILAVVNVNLSELDKIK